MAEETTQNPLAEGDGHAAWAKKMFDELDVDGSGQISVAELRTFLERTGKAMPYEEALALFNSHDSNDDGMIDFKEFMQLAVSLGRLDEQAAAHAEKEAEHLAPQEEEQEVGDAGGHPAITRDPALPKDPFPAGTLLKCVSRAYAITDAGCLKAGGHSKVHRRFLRGGDRRVRRVLPGEVVTVADDPHELFFREEGSIAVTLSGRPGVLFRVMLSAGPSTRDEHLQTLVLPAEEQPQKRFVRFVVSPVKPNGEFVVEIPTPGPLHMSCAQTIGGENT